MLLSFLFLLNPHTGLDVISNCFIHSNDNGVVILRVSGKDMFNIEPLSGTDVSSVETHNILFEKFQRS